MTPVFFAAKEPFDFGLVARLHRFGFLKRAKLEGVADYTVALNNTRCIVFPLKSA